MVGADMTQARSMHVSLMTPPPPMGHLPNASVGEGCSGMRRTGRAKEEQSQLIGDTRAWYGSSSSLHSSAVSVTSVDFAAELSWSRSVAPMIGAPM